MNVAAVRPRTLWLILGLLLFLPPLSLVPQFFGAVGFCGTWCPRMFLKLTPPGRIFASTYMGVALVAAVLAVTAWKGRYWCSHLCPIGGATELANRAVPRRVRLDFGWIHAPSLRYGYLAVFLLAPVLGLGSICCNLCNFSVVPKLFAAPFEPASRAYFLTTMGGINLASIVVLGVLARGGRAYCNLMCPVGAIDSLANAGAARLGRSRVTVDAAKCTGCGDCVTPCPVWAIDMADDKAHISPFSCLPCDKCLEACPRRRSSMAARSRWPQRLVFAAAGATAAGLPVVVATCPGQCTSCWRCAGGITVVVALAVGGNLVRRVGRSDPPAADAPPTHSGSEPCPPA